MKMVRSIAKAVKLQQMQKQCEYCEFLHNNHILT